MLAPKILSRRPLALLVSLSALALPQAAQAHTLWQSFIETFRTSPTLIAAQTQALQANEAYNQQVAQTKLQVAGTITGTFGYGTSPTGGNATTSSLQGGISATQALLQGDLDGIPAGVRQALGNVALANANYKSQEMSVMTQVVSAYMNVLREEASLGVSMSAVRNAEREVDAAQARLKAGEGTQTEIALADAGLAQARANLSLARAGLNGAKSTFRQVTSIGAHHFTDPGFPRLPSSRSAAVSQGLARHPSIKAAEFSLAIAKDAVITTRAQYGLSVTGQGSVTTGISDGPTGTSTSNNASISIQASIPLYDGGQREAAIRSAEQGLIAARANLDGQRAAVRAQIEGAWDSTKAQIESLNSLIAYASAQEVVLRATQAEFDAGTATILQVLTAQQNYAEAQSSYIRAKTDAVISSYNLISVSGGMTTEALGLPVTHFNSVERLEDNRNRTYLEIFRDVMD